MRRHVPVLLVAATLFAGSAAAAPPAPDLGSDAERAAGKKLYDVYCSQCHGDKGDGLGVAAPYVLPKPRDFTTGKFKIRTTPSGALPTTDDLKNIISKGMPYTAMPAWPQFDDTQLTNLAYYVKSFAPDFANPERQPEPIKISSAPSLSDESIEKGKAQYTELGCARCHGDVGRTDGMTAPTLVDDWGNKLRPADLTKRWTFRGGSSREDIFKAFSTGLNGTPMPSFFDALSEEQRWDLANYVYSLSPDDGPNYATLLVAQKITQQIELGEGEKAFENAEPGYFPLFGQIIQPGRSFYPAATDVRVRAVYNEDFIAFELVWNDMRAETTGKNGPEIQVPATEDEGEKPAATPAADAGGWGDAEETAPAPAPAAEADPWGEASADAAPAAAQSEFSDATALIFPSVRPETIRKPYFLFGDKGNPVDIWFADLARKDARLYVGQGSDQIELLGARELETVSAFDKGQWRVVIKRKLRAQGEITFEPGGFLPIAFSVWDGLSRERGNKRAITGWWTIYLSPETEKPSPAGEMAKWAGIVFVLEILFIIWARRRAKKPALQ